MRFNLKGDDYVRSGFVELNLNPVGDVYDVHYKVFLNLWKWVGKKVFGKEVGTWVPLPNYETSGSVRVPQSQLSEMFLKTTQPFEEQGVRFTPKGNGLFAFSKGRVTGEVQFGFDGRDPAEIQWFKASYDGKKVTGRP